MIIDFAEALSAAVKKIFPEAQIGHDYFHTSQLLNRGLLKELVHLQRTNFQKPIKELRNLRKQSIEAEKNGKIPQLKLENASHMIAWKVYSEIFGLKDHPNLKSFLNAWTNFKKNSTLFTWPGTKSLIDSVEQMLPNCGFSSKNFVKFWKKMCQTWRTLIRKERKIFEDDKKDFTKAKFVILMNPDNMETLDKIALRKALKKFPNLRDIREVVRTFHYQFKAPSHSWRSLSFLQKIVKKDSHQRLKAAVNTLVEHEDEIFAYRMILEKYPHLRKQKSIRSNREELNRKINNVARAQFGLRSTPSARIRIEGILNCSIIVSEELLKYEKRLL